MTTFAEALAGAGRWPLRPAAIATLQINVGKLCNQTCRHCHVDAGPHRTEIMTRETMIECLRVLDATSIPTADITGGAPELNPHFRWLVDQIAGRGRQCGVTVYPHRFRHHFSHTWLDRGGAEGDLMELNGWTSPQMLRRYGASARSARARRTYDRIMGDSP